MVWNANSRTQTLVLSQSLRLNYFNQTPYVDLKLRLSPAEPHFPILFPILVQSDRFIFLENRIDVVTPLQKSYC